MGEKQRTVDNMAGSEANGGSARTDVVPVVVGIGYVQMARVFGAVAVGVPN